MNVKKIMECEQRRFYKMINFRLPHKFMAIGIAVVSLSIVMMFVRAFAMEGDTVWLKAVLKKTLVIGMLLMSVSKDKEEDEMTVALRSQSYAFALVLGVIYAIVMPYIDYGVSNVVKPEVEILKDLGDFQVLLFMLLVQLLFYHNLKRYR
ncbi:hypothetical protein ACS386_11735 [Flavobacteriaceae bacterium LMO-SS05]